MAFSKDGAYSFRSTAGTYQNARQAPCAVPLAASHVHSSRATPAAGAPLAHTAHQGMLTGAPVLSIRGVALDLT